MSDKNNLWKNFILVHGFRRFITDRQGRLAGPCGGDSSSPGCRVTSRESRVGPEMNVAVKGPLLGTLLLPVSTSSKFHRLQNSTIEWGPSIQNTSLRMVVQIQAITNVWKPIILLI